MIYPHARYIAKARSRIGYGVFAKPPIPKGTITWVMDELDQRLSPAHNRRMHPLSESAARKYSYFVRLTSGR